MGQREGRWLQSRRYWESQEIRIQEMGRTWGPRFLLVTHVNKNIGKEVVLVNGRLFERGDGNTLNWLLLVEDGACLKETLHPACRFLLSAEGLGSKEEVILHWTHRKSLNIWWWLLAQPVKETFFQWWMQSLKSAVYTFQSQLVRCCHCYWQTLWAATFVQSPLWGFWPTVNMKPLYLDHQILFIS